MRSETLKFKVSLEEKEKIESAAKQYGSTVSDYIRANLLSEKQISENGKDRQALVRDLCELNRITEKVACVNLREKLNAIEVRLWQHIR